MIAVERSQKSVLKALYLNTSRYMFREARPYRRRYGPGADPPKIKVKTLAFTEDELQKVVQFLLSPENSTGLAWGEKFFTTTEWKQYMHCLIFREDMILRNFGGEMRFHKRDSHQEEK